MRSTLPARLSARHQLPRRIAPLEDLEARRLYSASSLPAGVGLGAMPSTQLVQSLATGSPARGAPTVSHPLVWAVRPPRSAGLSQIILSPPPVVALAKTTLALAESAASVQTGQAITFTAVVSATGSVTPSGNVTFKDGSIVLATITLDRGSASTTVLTLAAGTHSIQAIYRGDANSLASSSGVVTETVTAPAASPAAPPPPVVVSQPVAVAPPTIPGDWSLTFVDQFNATAIGPAWAPHQYWSTGATEGEGQETSIPANVSESGGSLNLAATSATKGALVQAGGIVGQTLPSESFTYGYIEARILVPQGANTTGLWPAFWLMPEASITTGVNHDADGEIDVMDNGLGNPAAMHGGVHIGSTQAQSAGPTLSAGWHTIALDWEPTAITWYIDGVAWYTESSLIPTGPEYPIFDLAVNDGSWGPPPTGSTQFPATMQVDWIHVWQQT